MAEFKKVYNAKGVLSNSDMELTEIKKEEVLVHDLAAALREFEGEEITITIAKKEEVQPKSHG